MILNENTKSDKETEYTFTGEVGCMVTEYILGDVETKGWVEEMRVGDNNKFGSLTSGGNN